MKKNIVLFLLNISMAFYSNAQPGFAVVELFTSEGCSSCPPAEKVLGDIIAEAAKNSKKVFCLEYHVDYWNHGGWKDPFSKNQFTMRQNNYSAALQQRELYTPQMIVNGETEFTGSYADKANAAINKVLNTSPAAALTIEVTSVSNDSAEVNYSSSVSDKNLSLHFALVESGLTSKIGKGENSGKTITHNRVVRVFYSVTLNEKKGMVKIPLKGLKPGINCSIVAFTQHKQSMKILSAAQKDFDGFLK